MELSDGVKATTRLIANNLSILAATSTVPNLIGNDYIDAWYSIYSGSFQIGTVTEKSNEIISAGKVIEQVPAPSSIVNSGSAVDLVISSGPINSIRGSYDGIWSSGDQRITFPVVKGKIPSFALRPSNGACGTTLTTTTYTPPFSISGNSFSFDGHSGTFNTNKSANVVFKYTANGPFCSGSGTVSGPVTKQLSPQTITFGPPPNQYDCRWRRVCFGNGRRFRESCDFQFDDSGRLHNQRRHCYRCHGWQLHHCREPIRQCQLHSTLAFLSHRRELIQQGIPVTAR